MELKKKQQITAFEVCLYLFFGVLALLTLYPFYNVLIVSFSNTVTSVKSVSYTHLDVYKRQDHRRGTGVYTVRVGCNGYSAESW